MDSLIDSRLYLMLVDFFLDFLTEWDWLSSSKSSEYPSDSFSKDFHLNEPDFDMFSDIDWRESVTFDFLTCFEVGCITLMLWNYYWGFFCFGDQGEWIFSLVGGSGMKGSFPKFIFAIKRPRANSSSSNVKDSLGSVFLCERANILSFSYLVQSYLW